MSSLSLSVAREFLMCILGFDTTWCSSPIFSQKYKFSYCSSRCLDPALVMATAVELDSISCKFVSIPGTFPSGSGQALSRPCYGITCARLSWPAAWKDLSFPGQVVKSLFYSRRCRFSGSSQAYRAHATASHAQDRPDWSLQDCPGWSPEKTYLSLE